LRTTYAVISKASRQSSQKRDETKHPGAVVETATGATGFATMPIYGKRASPRNDHPDLFDWHRDRELRRISHAAQRIAQRYRLPLHHAATIARLAGIDPDSR
jgi:hypothetical protein